MMKTSYSTIYNFRPNEMYGMGKESLIISGEYTSLEEFMENLMYNSSLKHENAKEYSWPSYECIEREDWIPWIGQPMFYIVDIKLDE